MTPKNRQALNHRVATAAMAALTQDKYVSSLDVLVGIGWLDDEAVKRWRQGQIDCLENLVQANLSRISEAMKLFRRWASEKRLKPSETVYLALTPQRETLRFSVSGNLTVERLYRTHWVSPELANAKRRRLEEKVAKAPELPVIQPFAEATAEMEAQAEARQPEC